jgi:hypothetical protein
MTDLLTATIGATQDQDAEDGFLAWLLLLGQQDNLPVNIPPGSDAVAVADMIRTCVAENHFAGRDNATVLDVAAHIGYCSDTGTLPAQWVRNGLLQAHRGFLRGERTVRTSFCTHCDAPFPEEPDIDPKDVAFYERALQAEPKLQAVDRVVTTFIKLVRPTDELCHGCIWDLMIKPLVRPWIGNGRGYMPKQAKDPDPEAPAWQIIPASEIMMEAPVRAETETEKWLRTSQAWDGFTRVLLERLEEADPANGHGIGRKQRLVT